MNAQPFILAADIGGTQSRFAIVEQGPAGLRFLVGKTYASRDHDGLDTLLERFLAVPDAAAARDRLAATCIAVAGPVSERRATLTNLGWQVDADALAAGFQLRAVQLINDFHAAGLGVTTLGDSSLATLQAAEAEERGTAVIIGAGTGLGVGILAWDGRQYRVMPSEAGHADFAAADELQDRLMLYMRRNFSRATWERVLSGPGLMRVFSFLQDSGLGVPSRQLLEATKRPGIDQAQVIAEHALAKLDPLAVRALDLFIAAYGSFAGNMALTTLSRGGVYIAGGIAPRILPRLKDGGFMRAFHTKGAFSGLLSGIPVRVVLDAQVGLRGAALVAAQAAG